MPGERQSPRGRVNPEYGQGIRTLVGRDQELAAGSDREMAGKLPARGIAARVSQGSLLCIDAEMANRVLTAEIRRRQTNFHREKAPGVAPLNVL